MSKAVSSVFFEEERCKNATFGQRSSVVKAIVAGRAFCSAVVSVEVESGSFWIHVTKFFPSSKCQQTDLHRSVVMLISLPSTSVTCSDRSHLVHNFTGGK